MAFLSVADAGGMKRVFGEEAIRGYGVRRPGAAFEVASSKEQVSRALGTCNLILVTSQMKAAPGRRTPNSERARHARGVRHAEAVRDLEIAPRRRAFDHAVADFARVREVAAGDEEFRPLRDRELH